MAEKDILLYPVGSVDEPVITPGYNKMDITVPDVQKLIKEDDEVSVAGSDEIDYHSPGDVPSRYLNLEFASTFHEHKKTALYEPVRDVLGMVYKWTKLITYHIFALVLGTPLMIAWALVNGIVAFLYTWVWSPVLRITIFILAAVLPLAVMPLVTLYRPLIDVGARCLRQIRIKGHFEGSGFVQNI